MAKKKKTQLRPVARGFATTSVPKKVIPPQLTLDEQLPQTEDDADNEDTLLAADGIRDGDTIVHELSNDGFDPEKVEEQSLQNLIDRFQEKTEKEITRCDAGQSRLWKLTGVIPRLFLVWTSIHICETK